MMSSSSNTRHLLSLFIVMADLPSNRQTYARQGMLLKKVISDNGYDVDTLDKMLTYMLSHKDEYAGVKSLAYLPYIYDSLMSKLAEEEMKVKIEVVENIKVTNNLSKSSKFGNGGLRKGDEHDWWLL